MRNASNTNGTLALLGRALHTLAWHALMPLQALALCTGLAGCTMALLGALAMLVYPCMWLATCTGMGCAAMLASLPLALLGMLCPPQPTWWR